MAMVKKTDENDKFKVIIMTGDGADKIAEERVVQIIDENNKPFNLEQLKKTIHDVRSTQEDKCKDIASLAGGIVGGNAEIHGFMIGWITSKIIQAHEEGKKTKCHISVSEIKELSRDDLLLGTAAALEEMAKYIKDNITNEELNISKLPNNPFNGLSEYE